ncbi:MAG: hypothetical protein Q7K20_04230 [Polaromonas sp.]|nr:hypothetical protein [Polaromonas sp.]
MQLAGAFMRQARPAAYASALMLLAMVAILYGYVEPAGLGLWAVAVVAVTLVRQLVIAFYQRKLQGVSGPALHAFMARCAWI